jgi:hypothetical protein
MDWQPNCNGSVHEGAMNARPYGDAGDALDFALDHIRNSHAQIAFLDDWRSAGDGFDFETRWPGFMQWLGVQREGAALAAATGTAKTPQAAECEASQSGPKGNAQ